MGVPAETSVSCLFSAGDVAMISPETEGTQVPQYSSRIRRGQSSIAWPMMPRDPFAGACRAAAPAVRKSDKSKSGRTAGANLA
jgi:hypothetical protein